MAAANKAVAAQSIFERAAEYEADHPEYAEVAAKVDLTLEEYQATLNALYRPTIVTSNSAETPVDANLE